MIILEDGAEVTWHFHTKRKNYGHNLRKISNEQNNINYFGKQMKWITKDDWMEKSLQMFNIPSTTSPVRTTAHENGCQLAFGTYPTVSSDFCATLYVVAIPATLAKLPVLQRCSKPHLIIKTPERVV